MYGTASRRIGHQPLEIGVADQMLLVQPHALRRPQPREADRVRADVVVLLQVQGVAHQGQHLEPPVVQPKQGPDAHVVAPGLHRPRHAVEPPEIIALAGAGRMHAGVGLVVVGFLEDLIGADAGRLDRGVAGVVQRGGVDVHAADFAVAARGGVDLAARTRP